MVKRFLSLVALGLPLVLLGLLSTPALSQQTAAKTYPKVTGTVVDSNGQPIADAEVFVTAAGTTDTKIFSATTGKEGTFTLEIDDPSENAYFTLLAMKKGHGVGTTDQSAPGAGLFPPNTSGLPDSTEVTVTLPEAKSVTFQVLDPQGKPLAKTLINTFSISRPNGQTYLYAPNNKIEKLQRSTDADGKVTFDFVPPKTVIGVAVETESYGRQNISFTSHQTKDNLQVKLLPTSEVKVTLKGDRDTRVSERKLFFNIQIGSNIDFQSGAPHLQVAWANPMLETDAQGVAQGRVVAGTATVYMQPEEGDKAFADTSKLQNLQLKAGETSEYVVEFKAGKKIRGRVVDTDGKPVQGVRLSISNRSATTDEDGNYEAAAASNGQNYMQVTAVPDGYVMPFQAWLNMAPSQGKAELVQPDIIVGRAVKFVGAVVDAGGLFVPNATITATWEATDPQQQSFTIKSENAKSDSEGKFELTHVQKDTEVLITAETKEMASAPQVVNTDDDQELQLNVSADGMTNIIGTVRNIDGKAVQNASIQISRAIMSPDGDDNYGQRPVTFKGKRTFNGEDDGTFTTPVKVPRFGKYSLQIDAPAHLGKRTQFFSVEKTGDLNVGETVLTKARTITGTIVDSGGKPIEGVTVSAYSSEKTGSYGLKPFSTTTDSDGNFSLEQIHPHAAMGMAKKEGFHTSGMPLLRKTTPQLTLYRSDESIPEEHTIRPVELDKGKRHEAAKQFIAKLKTMVDSNYFSEQLLQATFAMDGEAAIDEIRRAKSQSTKAKMLAKLGKFEDAFAEAASIGDAYGRCMARYSVAELSDDEDLWREALTTALVESEQAGAPDRRLTCISKVADAFHIKGDLEYAKMIITSQIPQAEEMESEGSQMWARGNFATTLALFDLDKAIDLVKAVEANDQERYYRDMAYRIAATDPEGAEKVLKEMTTRRYSDSAVVRVVHRMAKVDLARAIQLVETIDTNRRPVEKPRALGVIAMAIKDNKPEKARELLRDAFEAIPKIDPSGGNRSRDYFGASVTLLRYAETIDLERFTDYFWRTVEQYGGPRGRSWSSEMEEQMNAEQQAQLAILLTLYGQSPEVVSQIVEPIFEYWEKQIGVKDESSRFTDSEASYMAMALADPERASKWAIDYHDGLDPDKRRYIPQPYQVVAAALAFDREMLGKRITNRIFHRWVIGDPDFL